MAQASDNLPDRFLLEIDGVSKALRVVRFAGHEGMSELYRFEVIVASDDPALAFDRIVGANALFTMRTDDDLPRYVHGIVARFEQGDAGKKLTTYRVAIVPSAWLLLHRYDCRIFQDVTTPDILSEVLTTAGLAKGTDFRVSLQRSYRKREYCVQFRESDWAFVSRLMEEEGIYTYFEHEEDKHVLVIADEPAAYADIPGETTIPFRAPLGALSKGEHIRSFQWSEEVGTGAVATRDYDFVKPKLLLETKAEAGEFANLERYDYPGLYQAAHDRDALSRSWLEEVQAPRKMGRGESAVARLFPGHTFTLSDHGRESFNRKYVVVRIEHRGIEPAMAEHQDDSQDRYENRFECIPADVPFRPARVTPRPSVRGMQSAIVVGPPGEEIHVDEHGRVKVQFHWDRLGKNDKSSCWLRVSQLWAGEGWGAMFIPRVGQEVLVGFLDGDPDRPLVVGRLYHGRNVPPYPLPSEKTKSTIKSSSSPGGEGFNEIRFEDKKGSEEIYVHAQKDTLIEILNDKTQTVGHDEKLEVKNDRQAKVGHDQTLETGNDETFDVGRDRKKTIGRDETESIGNDRTIEVGHDHTEKIGNAMVLTVGKGKTEEVGDDSIEKVGKKRVLEVGSSYAIDVKSNMTTKVGASQTEEIEVSKVIKAGSKVVIECGSAKVIIEKSGKVVVEGNQLEVKGSKIAIAAQGEVSVQASGKVSVKGSGPMDVNASGPVKLKGANVGIN